MQNIPPLQGTQSAKVNYFIKITTPLTPTPEVLAFSDYPGPNVTYQGTTFLSLGALTGVGVIQRDSKATSFDTIVVIAGVDPTFVAKVLNDYYRGSTLEIFEGFLDQNYNVQGNTLYRAYSGKITGHSPQEIFDNGTKESTLTITLSSMSSRDVLQSEFTGRYTNSTSQKYNYPGDTTFDRVQTLQNIQLPYGKGVTS